MVALTSLYIDFSPHNLYQFFSRIITHLFIYLSVRFEIKVTSNICRLNFHKIAPHLQGNAYFIQISTDHGAQWFP